MDNEKPVSGKTNNSIFFLRSSLLLRANHNFQLTRPLLNELKLIALHFLETFRIFHRYYYRGFLVHLSITPNLFQLRRSPQWLVKAKKFNKCFDCRKDSQ